MMLNKLFANKKVLVVLIVILLALSVGSVVVVTSSLKNKKGNDLDVKTEQSKEDDETQLGLEVLEPDEVTPEDSSSVSGTWDDSSDSDSQTGDTTVPNQPEKPSEPSDEDDKNNNQEGNSEPEDNKDILKDDITWGDIY